MIEVVNPNNSAEMTAAIGRSCRASGVDPSQWRVTRIVEAPETIETSDDVRECARLVGARAAPGGLMIVACHADPGVDQARRCGATVLGIGETSMRLAAASVDRFAVLTLSEDTAVRKRQVVERLGLSDACAAIVPTGRGALDGLRTDVDLAPYLVAVEASVRQGAQAVVLGCAGMQALRAPLQEQAGVPVVDPVAATLLAASALTPPSTRNLDRHANHREGALGRAGSVRRRGRADPAAGPLLRRGRGSL